MNNCSDEKSIMNALKL